MLSLFLRASRELGICFHWMIDGCAGGITVLLGGVVVSFLVQFHFLFLLGVLPCHTLAIDALEEIKGLKRH